MKEDIHYTNLMLEFEKLNGRLDRIEEKLDEMGCELKGSPTLTPPDGVSVEDFGRFWNEAKVNKFNSFHLDAVGIPPTETDEVAAKYICLWENIPEKDRTKPKSLSCLCRKCTPYSMS